MVFLVWVPACALCLKSILSDGPIAGLRAPLKPGTLPMYRLDWILVVAFVEGVPPAKKERRHPLNYLLNPSMVCEDLRDQHLPGCTDSISLPLWVEEII